LIDGILGPGNLEAGPDIIDTDTFQTVGSLARVFGASGSVFELNKAVGRAGPAGG